MAGKRQKRTHRKIKKEVMLASVLILTSIAFTPPTPASDRNPLSPTAVAVAPAPSGSILEEQCPDQSNSAAQSVEEPQPSPPEKPAPTQDDTPEKSSEQSDQQSAEHPVAGTDLSAPPKVSAPVTDDYFSDAAFVGDSRTEGFHLYSGLKQGTYFFSVGATVQTVMEKETQQTASGKQTILDALSEGTYNKVYVMLGVNELGWFRTEDFTNQYGKVIDRIQTDHPDANIIIQSILPVSADQDKKHSYVNNPRITLFNELLEQLASDKGCVFLDVASCVTGEDGTLPSELSTDGVHLNTAGCKKWLDYLRSNPI